jgi:hypothetical protein
MPDQKLHPILAGLKQELALGYQEETYDLGGYKWTMRTLGETEEIWVSKFANADTVMALITSTRAARLAACIKQINGTPVDGMFEYPDDMAKAQRTALDTNPIDKHFWVMDQLLQFIIRSVPPPMIDALWGKWLEMSNKRTAEMEEKLPNFSTRTQNIASVGTSSPAPEPSPQTQP